MYENPIQLKITNITESIGEQVDRAIMERVKLIVGININEDELRKALRYDRDQYWKGHEDGVREGKLKSKWELHLLSDDSMYFAEVECSRCGNGWKILDEDTSYVTYPYCPWCGSRMEIEQGKDK